MKPGFVSRLYLFVYFCSLKGNFMFDLNDYEKILIGIGEDFNIIFPEKCNNQWDELRFLKDNVDLDIMEAYNHLSDVLGGRDYFVVSTCTDDLIYKSNLLADKIVTPCGGYRYLQCQDDCSNELLPFDESMLNHNEDIICPHCKKPVVFNKMPMEKYNEGGYLEQWQLYNKWLQSTINKKLLIIELGVGLTYPSVIRFPFEKTCFYNQKSVLYRIHKSLAFSTPELKERCVCESTDPVEYMAKM